jgi:glycogen debranching enzyme
MTDHVLKEDELVLLTNEAGDIPAGRRRLGLYHCDVRHLSIFEASINGHKPRLLASSCHQNATCSILLANPTLKLSSGTTVLARTVSIQRVQYLHKGLHERITLYNYNTFPVPIELTLAFGCDFRDILEIRGLQRRERGTILRPSVSSDSHVNLAYVGLDGVKRTSELLFDNPPSKINVEEGSVTFTRPSTLLPEATTLAEFVILHPPTASVTWALTLEPKQPSSVTLHVLASDGATVPATPSFGSGVALARHRYEGWRSQCTQIETDNELFNGLLERSVLDLCMLLTPTPEGAVPAAGIPWYSCVMGSASLVTSLETLMLNPEIAVSTLRYLSRHQGATVDPVRAEEPGKIVGEIRKGELAATGETPHAALYDTVDATPLFLVVFAELMKWVDDDTLFEELRPTVKPALDWLERYGDTDGDSYIEYSAVDTADSEPSPWEDSRGSICYANGTRVPYPVSLAHIQGYTYRALQEMSALLRRKGAGNISRKLTQRARALKRNFNRDFWLEKQHFFAQALDAENRPVRTASSTIGHCLYAGIVDEDKAGYVVARLSSTDMSTGWGISTISRKEGRFNPMSYRSGSVWPHDTALAVAGMKRYGYPWEVEEVTSQMVEASQHFPSYRLPELFCGFPRHREAFSGPAEYPVASSPFAMAAGSPILMVQSMLGLQADAASKRIYVSPRLPCWLQHVTARNLRIGTETVTLHFERQGDATRFDISDNEAGVEVVLTPL